MTPEEFKQKHEEYFKDYSDEVAVEFYNSMLKRFEKVVSDKTFLESRKYTFFPSPDELKYADSILKLIREKGWEINLVKKDMYDPEYFVVFVD